MASENDPEVEKALLKLTPDHIFGTTPYCRRCGRVANSPWTDGPYTYTDNPNDVIGTCDKVFKRTGGPFEEKQFVPLEERL